MTTHIVPDEFALHTAEAIALTKPEQELAPVLDIMLWARQRRTTRRSAWGWARR